MNKKTLSREKKAEIHRKTRAAHSQEIAEDYVEAIAELIAENGKARLVELAKLLGVTHVTVNKTLSRLAESELIISEPYQAIELTKKGKALAEKCKKRHLAVVEFLKSIGVPEEVAESDAEGIEHHVSEKTLKAFINHTKLYCKN